MALKQCKECGAEVSTKAESCPKCGAVQKKKTSCLGCIGLCFLSFIALCVLGGLVGSKSSTEGPTTSAAPAPTPAPKQPKIYNEGETVNIGYTSYAVWRSWWSHKLSDNQFLDDKPNAMYLFVELTVRNDDKKARTVPPFSLVDENGAEYQTASKAWAVEGSIGVLESLNPSVQKKGTIVFDVPHGRKYKLKVLGGYWSPVDAFVILVPKE